MSQKNLVIYRANCFDGMGAVMAAKKFFGDAGLLHTTAFMPMNFGDETPTVDKNTHVIILDFSFKRHQMVDLAHSAASVTIFDHHKTAKEDIEPLLEEGVVDGVFDMNRSGAGIAWDEMVGRRPRIVDLLEDYDLWRFDLEGTEEVHLALLAVGINDLEKMEPLFEDDCDIQSLVDMGAVLLKEKRRRVAEAVAETTMAPCLVNKYGEIPICNCPGDIASAVGAELSKDHPYSATFVVLKDGIASVSLRSSKDNPDAADVSEIARELGGGGHFHAAGARIQFV